jgi:hypothetical protein
LAWHQLYGLIAQTNRGFANPFQTPLDGVTGASIALEGGAVHGADI